MLTFYPAIKPNAVHKIKVTEIHNLYVEESGNPEGLPVVVIHGGPGGGTIPLQRQFFDPTVYRIIMFDQRGAGLSTPHAELTDNNTEALVQDMEVIRKQLNIEKWVLFGGSWGATLALVYAETHPDRVLSMILRGTFLCRQKDFDWFYKEGGASRLFPEAWDELTQHIPITQDKSLIECAYEILTGQDEVARMATAKAWAKWEGTCSTLLNNPETVEHFTHPHLALSLARIETHYFHHNAFLTPNQILDNAHLLENIPGIMIHGRYDLVCPLDNAYDLSKVWPKGELKIVRDAGHAAFEPGIVAALINATQEVAQRHQP